MHQGCYPWQGFDPLQDVAWLLWARLSHLKNNQTEEKGKDTVAMGDIYLVGAYVGLSEGLACVNIFVRGVVALKQIMHCEQLPKLIHQLSLNYGIISCLLRREEQEEFHNQSHSPGLEAYYEIFDCRGGN